MFHEVENETTERERERGVERHPKPKQIANSFRRSDEPTVKYSTNERSEYNIFQRADNEIGHSATTPQQFSPLNQYQN